jgi:tetratricopeptide (TPR) repeat protein
VAEASGSREKLAARLLELETAARHGEIRRVEEGLVRLLPAVQQADDEGFLAWLLLIRSMLLRTVQGPEAALVAVRKLRAEFPHDPRPAVEQAVVLADLGRHAEAEAAAEEAVRLAEGAEAAVRAEAHRALGYARFLAGRRFEALAALDTALRILPGEIQSLRLRGQVHFQLGAHAEALRDLSAAIERGLAPNARLCLMLAQAAEGAGVPLEGLRWLERLARVAPDARALSALYSGHLLVAAGRFEEALARFSEIPLDRAPDWLRPVVAADHARALHELGRREEAVTALRQALEQAPSRIDLEELLIENLLALEELEEALRVYLGIQRRDPAMLLRGIGARIRKRLIRAIAAEHGLELDEQGNFPGAAYIVEREDGRLEVRIYRSSKEVPELFEETYREAFGLGVPTAHKVEFMLRVARRLRRRGDHAAAADLLELAVEELRSVRDIRTIWDEALIDVIDRCSEIWSALPRRFQQALLQNEANLAAARRVGSTDYTAFANEFFRILELLLDEKLIRPLHARFPGLGLRKADTILSLGSFRHRLRQPAVRSALGEVLPLARLDELARRLDQVLDRRVSTHGWLHDDVDRLREAFLGGDNPGLYALVIELSRTLG